MENTMSFSFSAKTVLLFLMLLTISVFPQKKDEFNWNDLDKYVEQEFGKIIKGTAEDKMIQDIAKNISKYIYSNEHKLTIKLIDNDEPNAFAFGNGNMYVLTGLFKTTESVNELAFVIAHEFSHVLLQHSTEAEEFKSRFNISSQDDQKMKAFTREQEYEADKYGILYALRAGYSPLGSVNWFNKMTNLGYEYPPLYVDYSDHPNFTQRVVQAFINIGTYYEYAKHFDYGLLYITMGNYSEAAEAFGKFLEKYPNYKEAYNNIAVAQMINVVAEKDVTLDLWVSASLSKVSLFADNFDKPVRGNYTFQTRDFADALESIQKANKLDPKYAQPYVNLALINIFTKDYTKAKTNLDLALKYDAELFEAHIAKGFLLVEQNNLKDAIKSFDNAIQIDNQNAQGYYNLAWAYQWNKQNDLAIQAWQRFLVLMPEGNYADIARQNLEALKTGNAPTITKNDNNPKDKTVYSTNNLGLAGVELNDDQTEVKNTLQTPDNKTADKSGDVWEYLTPNITIGFDKAGKVEYVLVFDRIEKGLESVGNINVGSSVEEVINKFGRPIQVLTEGGYLVYNYQNLGIAFWVLDGKVKGIGIYRI